MERIIPPAFDSLVLPAVAREIQQDPLDGPLTGLVQPAASTVGLRLRTRRGTTGLLCSIHPRWARCVIAPLPEGRAVHPFAVQLRARLDGGRLRAAAVESFERVLTLTCETLEGDVRLVLEVMGRHSNMLLVEGERVAGAFKTVTPAMSRVRPIAVGQRYTRPPRTRPTPAEGGTAGPAPRVGWGAAGARAPGGGGGPAGGRGPGGAFPGARPAGGRAPGAARRTGSGTARAAA